MKADTQNHGNVCQRRRHFLLSQHWSQPKKDPPDLLFPLTRHLFGWSVGCLLELRQTSESNAAFLLWKANAAVMPPVVHSETAHSYSQATRHLLLRFKLWSTPLNPTKTICITEYLPTVTNATYRIHSHQNSLSNDTFTSSTITTLWRLAYCWVHRQRTHVLPQMYGSFLSHASMTWITLIKEKQQRGFNNGPRSSKRYIHFLFNTVGDMGVVFSGVTAM